MLTRRTAITAALTTPFGGRVSFGSTRRTLKVMSNANVAGIHVPGNVACREGMQQTGAYGPPDFSRLEKQSAITQILVGGGIDIGDTDTPSACAAAVPSRSTTSTDAC